MTILFWNMNRKPLEETIRGICDAENVDVIVLAESSECSTNLLLRTLNTGRSRKYWMAPDVNAYLKILSSLPHGHIELVSDPGRMSIRHLTPPAMQSILLVAVHLPSRREMGEAELGCLATRWPFEIAIAESVVNHQRTVVIGDFNMNPFDHGMIGSEGFHAVMCRRVAAKLERKVQAERKPFFYNPMWNQYGESPPNPHGTYYYGGHGRPHCYFWNNYDQVLLRPSLLSAVSDSNVRVVSKVGDVSLLRNGVPDKKRFSDHLPLLITMDDSSLME